jgi:hypothetical protein
MKSKLRDLTGDPDAGKTLEEIYQGLEARAGFTQDLYDKIQRLRKSL